MSSSERSTLQRPEDRALVLADLIHRARGRLDALDDGALDALAEDALWHQRRRAERHALPAAEAANADALVRALLRGSRAERQTALLSLVSIWAAEIHGRFDPRVYRFATRAAPRLLAGLLTGPEALRTGGAERVVLQGDVARVRALGEDATLVLVPTHVSNLDSPLVGLALHQAGLPPFLYGAGLNLFSNAWLGWWMRRLGAYTVDRTKKAKLYLDLLKDYSIRAVAAGQHSLFFPGGTRARSGAVETRLKRGLLGTGVAGWQQAIAGGRERDVAFVPLTLSYQLVLEGSTLIADHLEEVGRQRAIITDDESAASRTVLSFLRRVVDLDATVVLHFGTPLDVVGRPIPADPVERREAANRRRRLVTDRQGAVEVDAQRDSAYTDLLASALVRAWRQGAVWMATHAAAWAAWTELARVAGTRDPIRLERLQPGRRVLRRDDVRRALAEGLRRVQEAASRGDGHTNLPDDPEGVLAAGIEHFGRWHRTRALRAEADTVVVEDARLCLFYANRSPWADPPT